MEIVGKARDDRLQIQFVHRNLEHFVQEMDRASNRLSFAIVIAALAIAGSLAKKKALIKELEARGGKDKWKEMSDDGTKKGLNFSRIIAWLKSH